jgi:hypothetical protein
MGETTYYYNQPIHLLASNYVKKLDNVYIESINTIQKKSLVDIISDIIKQIDTSNNTLGVNMSIYPSTATKDSSNSALNLVGMDTEVFWKNNIERDNGLEIITKILKPLNSYLYYYNGWFIDRYEDGPDSSIEGLLSKSIDLYNNT